MYTHRKGEGGKGMDGREQKESETILKEPGNPTVCQCGDGHSFPFQSEEAPVAVTF